MVRIERVLSGKTSLLSVLPFAQRSRVHSFSYRAPYEPLHQRGLSLREKHHMTKNNMVSVRLLVGILCSYSMSGLAVAQSASPPTKSDSQVTAGNQQSQVSTPEHTAAQLQEITVTSNFIASGGKSALKMSVPVRDIPFSLEGYSHSFMKAVDTTRLTDLYGYMSDVQRAGNTGYDINIRGFSSSANDPNSILVDGLPGLPARTASPETADLERVEVVKGPASVLYGKGQPGGFINLITKKPQARYESNVELRAATYDGGGIPFGRKNGYTGIVDTTGSIDDSGRLLGRAIVQYTNQQTFRAFVLDKDVMVAPSLTWNMSRRTKATLLLEFRHGNDSWDEGLVAPDNNAALIAPSMTRYQNPEDKEVEKGETATLLVHHTFSPSLSWDFNVRSVYTEDYEIGFANGKILKNPAILERQDDAKDNHHHVNYIDTSLTDMFHTGPVRHRILAGITVGETIEDYNRIRNFYTTALNINIYDPVPGYSDIAPLPQSEPPQKHTWGSAKSYGAYATDLLSFTAHWKGVLGARYEDVEEVQKELRLPGVPEKRRSFTDAIPMAGLIYQPTKSWSLYASYSTSYVPPPPGAQPFIPGQSLNAQSAAQDEVGAKFESPRGLASATLSVFNIKETNLIQIVGHTGLYEQIGADRSRGMELQVDVRPTAWWQLNANYALVDARVTDSTIATQIGSKLLNSPRNSGSILSRIQFPGRFNQLGWMLGVVYRSERAGSLPSPTNPNQFIMPGYPTVDTAIYYTADTFDISMKVSNVLDKRYLQGAYSAVAVNPGEPRNIALTATKTFE